ncbi:RHS repeat-associated core domain-containing protein, partial [Comamonadaceae bacterium OH2545_COT-014]
AFGAAGIIQSQSTIEMNLRFPGQYFDQETNSHYNFHRDYKPNLGRYVQSDPIGLEGGVNIYEYARSNPKIFLDLNGLSPGGWGLIGRPPSGRINTIYCRGGKLELYIIPMEAYKKCPPIEECLRVHEETHRKDALRFNSRICNGVDNVAVGYYGEDGKPPGKSIFIRDAELRAFDNQISCLEAALRKEDCDPWCQEWIKSELQSRRNQRIQVIAGTYWS